MNENKEIKHRKRIDDLYLLEKKNKFLHYPVLALIFIELAIYHLGNMIEKKLFKIILLVLAVIIWPIMGSYIFISDINDKSINQLNANDNLNYNVIFADDTVSQNDSFYFADNNNGKNTDKNTDSVLQDNILENTASNEESFYSNEQLLEEANYSELNEASIAKQRNVSNINLADFDKESWNLVLINKQHPFSDDYEFELGTIVGSFQCDARIMDYLMLMLSNAKEDGIILNVCSPYRNHERQVKLFNNKIKTYMKKGYSYKDAYMLTSQAVTIPGSSEHEVGLAIDFNTKNYTTLDEGFAKTDAGIWLNNHAHEYGFILRYPDEKEDITGIEYEPWHYRFVGVSEACYIHDNNLCLEEFCELINK